MTPLSVLYFISLAVIAIVFVEFIWSMAVNAIGYVLAMSTPQARIRSHWILRMPPSFCLIHLGVLLGLLSVTCLVIAFLLLWIHPHRLMNDELFKAAVVLVSVSLGIFASLVRRHVFSGRIATRHAIGHPFKDKREYAIVLTREGADLYSLHVSRKNRLIPSLLPTSDISLKHNPELVIPQALTRIGPGMRLLLATPNIELYQAVSERMDLIRAAAPNRFQYVQIPVNWVIGRWGNRRYKWGQPDRGPYHAKGYIIYT